METVGDRFRLLRKRKRLNQQELARELEVSQGSLSDIERNNSKPAFDTLSRLLYRFTDISPGWLLTGEGPMLLGEAVPDQRDERPHQVLDARGFPVEQQGEMVELPVSGIIAAGPPVQNVDIEPLGTVRLSLPNHKDYIVFQVHGASMEPQIRDGDLALIYTPVSWFSAHGKICAVSIQHEVTLKRLGVDNVKRLIVLTSINSDYTPIVVEPEKDPIKLLGRLSHLIRYYP